MRFKVGKIAKNASWIIGCRVLQSIVNLIISMITARYLGPSNFGIINYAASIVAFAVPIMQLGITNVLVQEIVSNPESEGEILGTSLVMCMSSSLLCIVGVDAFAVIVNRTEHEVIVVCILYSLILLVQALEITIYWFQAKYLSKYSAILSFLAYVIVAGYKAFLLISGKGVYWFAVSNALDLFLIAVGLLFFYKKLGGQRLSYSHFRAKELFEKSHPYIASSMMVAIFSQTDRVMIKLMLNDAETGFYSAAGACAMMTNFIFTAIIDSYRPAIFQYHKISEESFDQSVSTLYAIVIYMSLLQSLFMTFFAKIVIGILYGSAYLPAVETLRIVVWFTTFSYLGSVRNIWILAKGKQRYLWIINSSGAFANVILNYIMIPMFGANGAAAASLITQIFTNVVVGFLIKPIRYNNTLMLRGVHPRFLKTAFGKIFAKKSDLGEKL